MDLLVGPDWVGLVLGCPDNDPDDDGQDYNPDNGQDQLLFPSFVLKY